MSEPIKIDMPLLRIVMPVNDGDTDSTDLVQFELQTENKDAIRYDIIRKAKNWPVMDEGGLLWLTVLAWSVMRRAGKTKLPVEKFLDTCVSLTPVKDDEDGEDETGTPIRAVADIDR